MILGVSAARLRGSDALRSGHYQPAHTYLPVATGGWQQATVGGLKTSEVIMRLILSLLMLVLLSPAVQEQESLAGLTLYALDNNNTIHIRRGCSIRFRSLLRIPTDNGQVIGIDFRPADGWLYALTDQGVIHQIDVDRPGLGNVIRVSILSPRFAGGVQSLADFNPVANALRLIGSNDQNFAVVNGGGNLQQTVPQTRLAYAAGDVNAGVDPNIVGGGYTNNVAGAATTIFYALDFDLDNLVTIAPPLVGAGSSNTGGGQLQTIGSIVTASGNPINVTPTADIDIYTDSYGNNTIIGVSGRTLFTIDLSQINQSLPVGYTQQVLARTIRIIDGGFVDVAVSSQQAQRCFRN